MNQAFDSQTRDSQIRDSQTLDPGARPGPQQDAGPT